VRVAIPESDRSGRRADKAITAVDGRPTPSTDALATVLATLQPGRRVRVDLVDRGGASRTVTVTVGEAPG
jgi:S1-C subfamily serine protease